MNLEAVMNELNITPEQLAFIVVQALEQMVKVSEEKGQSLTSDQIFEAIVKDPNGAAAKYFKLHLELGVKALDMVKAECK